MDREELQRQWENYRGRSALQQEELANLKSQADRIGVILEIDLDDNTARIKLEPDHSDQDKEL